MFIFNFIAKGIWTRTNCSHWKGKAVHTHHYIFYLYSSSSLARGQVFNRLAQKQKAIPVCSCKHMKLCIINTDEVISKINPKFYSIPEKYNEMKNIPSMPYNNPSQLCFLKEFGPAVSSV